MGSIIKVLYVLSSCTVLTRATHIVAVPRPRNPAAFRPGATLNRPWTSRVSHPYTAYRPLQQHDGYMRAPQVLRPVKLQSINGRTWPVGYRTPWRTSRPPAMPFISEYEFTRPTTTPAPVIVASGVKGAIHTIPAPNLSLSEKPIVVEDTSMYANGVTVQAEPNYPVTEKINMDVTTARPGAAMIEIPQIGFSRDAPLTPSELAALMQSGTVHLVDYVPPAIAVPHSHYKPQYNAQVFDTIVAAPVPMANDGFLPQSTLFKPDHTFFQNTNDQFYQNYPIEFVPYQPEQKPESHSEFQIYLLEDEVTKEKDVLQNNHKNVIRNTHENLIVTLVPRIIEVMNATDESMTGKPEALTTDIVTSETQYPTTTVKHIVETTTEKDKTTPIYYAPIGRTVEDSFAKGFYSAINDVRAAAALALVEKAKPENEISNVTMKGSEVKLNHIESIAKSKGNSTANQRTFIQGVPFSKPEPAEVAYTFLRAEDKDKVIKDGAVYAGQIVEAAVMEDRNSAGKENNLAIRAPLRLLMVEDNHDVTTETSKLPVAKTKVPPKSKIIKDAKTGEPVLRIFASYVDNPLQKETVISKINMKQKDTAQQYEILDSGKEGKVKNLDEIHEGSDTNQVAEFGIKLRPKLDDYTSIFEEREKK